MPTTAVLLHGFSNTGASWAGVVAALPERYRAVTPDIRGHGSAAGRRPVTLEAVIEDIAGLSPDPYTLVGYSMGGRIALHLGFALAARVSRVVLIGSSPGLREATARAQRRADDERLAAEVERSTIEQFAARWSRSPVLADQPAKIREAVDLDRRRNTPDGLAAALRGLGTGALPSLWSRLGQLAIPVELVVGERDAKFRAIAVEMARSIPDGRVSIVTGAGHAVHWEAPAAVARIIADRSN